MVKDCCGFHWDNPCPWSKPCMAAWHHCQSPTHERSVHRYNHQYRKILCPILQKGGFKHKNFWEEAYHGYMEPSETLVWVHFRGCLLHLLRKNLEGIQTCHYEPSPKWDMEIRQCSPVSISSLLIKPVRCNFPSLYSLLVDQTIISRLFLLKYGILLMPYFLPQDQNMASPYGCKRH